MVRIDFSKCSAHKFFAEMEQLSFGDCVKNWRFSISSMKERVFRPVFGASRKKLVIENRSDEKGLRVVIIILPILIIIVSMSIRS